MSPLDTALTIDVARNPGIANRSLRGGQTVDGMDDNVSNNEDGNVDGEERVGPFDGKIAKWRRQFTEWKRNGQPADDVYKDLGVDYYINKYGHNLSKLSKKEEYQKWIAYKAFLEKVDDVALGNYSVV
ncbi:hypothetical protein BBO99_00008801 [Phytophthora kernoviae]|uniref:RxLR effector protein n=1 Tax=Phytophthora kernoviae TaxID=325452 RepID=A0A3R7GRC5_9STRA|nr:hypothetical protein JM16_009518 [Phytophthora kernoviae]RLN14408.1 hypothetical protein BBI17_009569 [Phytophthora kernoviae]RLN74678.1 hypothetical protein BBO99_00008801 [Phytophthora kernoviae]